MSTPMLCHRESSRKEGEAGSDEDTDVAKRWAGSVNVADARQQGKLEKNVIVGERSATYCRVDIIQHERFIVCEDLTDTRIKKGIIAAPVAKADDLQEGNPARTGTSPGMTDISRAMYSFRVSPYSPFSAQKMRNYKGYEAMTPVFRAQRAHDEIHCSTTRQSTAPQPIETMTRKA